MPYKIRKLIKTVKEAWYDFLFRKKFPETHHIIEKIKGGGAYNVGNAKYLELFRLLNKFRPKSVLELGGGGSTAVFAMYAKENNIKIDSVDQREEWLNNTKTALDGLSKFVNFILLPAKFDRGSAITKGFYDGLENKYYDFVYVDGPSFPYEDKKKAVYWNVVDLIKSAPPRFIVVDGRYSTVSYIAASYRHIYDCYANLSLSLLSLSYGAHSVFVRAKE